MTDKIRIRHRQRPIIASASGLREAFGSATPQPSEPEASDDYEVGYSKPPKETRFQPGRTGNPRGRPKGSRNLKTELLEELHEKVLVKERGTRHTVSKQRAMLKSLTARALQGDARAASLLINLVLRLLNQDEDPAQISDLDEEDTEILQRFEARVRRRVRSKEDKNNDD